MIRTTGKVSMAAAIAWFALAYAADAAAYVGPGAGLTAIGTVVALLGGLLLAIVGFVWYPIKRLLKRRPKAPSADAAPAEDPPRIQETPPDEASAGSKSGA